MWNARSKGRFKGGEEFTGVDLLLMESGGEKKKKGGGKGGALLIFSRTRGKGAFSGILTREEKEC